MSEKSATPAKTDQEKHATRQTLSGKKCNSSQTDQENVLLVQTCQEKSGTQSFDRFNLIDLIDFISNSMFCLTSF